MLALLVEDLTDEDWLCEVTTGAGFVEGRPWKIEGTGGIPDRHSAVLALGFYLFKFVYNF